VARLLVQKRGGGPLNSISEGGPFLHSVQHFSLKRVFTEEKLRREGGRDAGGRRGGKGGNVAKVERVGKRKGWKRWMRWGISG